MMVVVVEDLKWKEKSGPSKNTINFKVDTVFLPRVYILGRAFSVYQQYLKI